jgi:hypothetical protein
MGDKTKLLPNEDKLAEVEQLLQQLEASPVSHKTMVSVMPALLWGDLTDTTAPKAITKETLVRVLLSIVTKQREEIVTPAQDSGLQSQKSMDLFHTPSKPVLPRTEKATSESSSDDDTDSSYSKEDAFDTFDRNSNAAETPATSAFSSKREHMYIQDFLKQIERLNGEESYDKLLAWIQKNETFHALSNCNENWKIMVAISRFDGKAQRKWSDFRNSSKGLKVQTWNQLAAWKKDSFIDTNIKKNAFDALRELKQQKSMTVRDYNEKYDKMLNLCHTQTPWTQVRFYIGGLKPHTRKSVESKRKNLRDINAPKRAAVHAEDQTNPRDNPLMLKVLDKNDEKWKSKPGPSAQKQSKNKQDQQPKSEKKKFSGPCRICNKMGHKAFSCPDNKKNMEKSNFVQAVERVNAQYASSEQVNKDNDTFYSSVHIDSGSGRHMFNDPKWFSTLNTSTFPKVNIVVADGRSVESKGVGEVRFNELTLKECLYIPMLSQNLISVGQLTDDGFQVSFDTEHHKVFAKKNNKTYVIGVCVGNDYNLLKELDEVPEAEDVNVFATTPQEPEEFVLWHERLCHISKTLMKKLQQTLKEDHKLRKVKGMKRKSTGHRLRILEGSGAWHLQLNLGKHNAKS